jgi:hypothetical protein
MVSRIGNGTGIFKIGQFVLKFLGIGIVNSYEIVNCTKGRRDLRLDFNRIFWGND